MSKAAKLTLLAVVLIVLAFVVGQLRRQGSGYAPSASVPGTPGNSEFPQSTMPQVRNQPTILQARSAAESNGLRSGTDPRNGNLPPHAEPDPRYRSTGNYAPNSPQVPRREREIPGNSFSNDSWPVSRTLRIPSPFQLDQLSDRPAPVAEPPAEAPENEFAPTPLPPLPPLPRQQPTCVQSVENDSLWNISVRVYGVGDYYKALYYHNRDRIKRPDTILPGLVILTPTIDELRNLYPDLCPASVTR